MLHYKVGRSVSVAQDGGLPYRKNGLRIAALDSANPTVENRSLSTTRNQEGDVNTIDATVNQELAMPSYTVAEFESLAGVPHRVGPDVRHVHGTRLEIEI